MGFDDYYKTGKDFAHIENIKELVSIAESLMDRKIQNALDIGCGTGELLEQLNLLGIQATGIDTSKIALEKAKKRNVIALYADMETPYEGTYDIIFSKLSLAFAKDKRLVLSHVYSALKNGGVFVLITPILLGNCLYKREKIKNISIPKRELEQMLKDTFNMFAVHAIELFDEDGIQITYIMQK